MLMRSGVVQPDRAVQLKRRFAGYRRKSEALESNVIPNAQGRIVPDRFNCDMLRDIVAVLQIFEVHRHRNGIVAEREAAFLNAQAEVVRRAVGPYPPNHRDAEMTRVGDDCRDPASGLDAGKSRAINLIEEHVGDRRLGPGDVGFDMDRDPGPSRPRPEVRPAGFADDSRKVCNVCRRGHDRRLAAIHQPVRSTSFCLFCRDGPESRPGPPMSARRF